MIVRELVEQERGRLTALLLALSERDRYWRFCRPMTDAALVGYVDQIDWDRAVVLGAFDAQARLTGVLELCDNESAAEIAVAVAAEHRGCGVARTLMDRALLKAKALGKERVTLTCLVENLPMRRLARGAGLSARSEGGEIEGSLTLAHVRPDELVENAAQEFIGSVTYAGALYSRALAELFERSLAAPAALGAALTASRGK
jgi:RimJ/RimL family protein N-acetyltransferase